MTPRIRTLGFAPLLAPDLAARGDKPDAPRVFRDFVRALEKLGRKPHRNGRLEAAPASRRRRANGQANGQAKPAARRPR